MFEESPLEKVIQNFERLERRLEYESMPWGLRKMTRREFMPTLVGLLGGSSLVLGTSFGTYEYLHSPEKLRQDLIKEYETTGNIDSEKVAYFTRRLLEERMMPALERTMQNSVITSSYNDWPQQVEVETGLYQIESILSLSAGYSARIFLLASLVLGREDLFDYYKNVVDALRFDSGIEDEPGYRHFRIVDPLEELVTLIPRTEEEQRLIEDAQEKLRETKRYLVGEDRLNVTPDFEYVLASASPTPHPGFEHEISTSSYYLVKHLQDSHPDIFDRHMEALSALVIEDGRAYDMMSFNAPDDTKIDLIRISSTYDDDTIDATNVFHQNNYTLSLMIDLFGDWVAKFGKGREEFESLRANFERQLRSSGDLPEFSFAEEVGGVNNLALAIYFHGITEKQRLVTQDELKDTCFQVLNRMSLSGEEGVFPNCRLDQITQRSTPTYLLMSDYLILKGLTNMTRILENV